MPGLRDAVLNLDDAFGARARAAPRAARRAHDRLQRSRGARRRRDRRRIRLAGAMELDIDLGRARRRRRASSAASTSSNVLGVLGCLLAYGIAVRGRGDAARRAARRCPGAWSRSASGRWSSSTTRTRPTRSRRCCRRCARSPQSAAAGWSCVFGCGGDRDPGQAAADGRGRGAPRRPRRSSPPTTRAARIPLRSSTRSRRHRAATRERRARPRRARSRRRSPRRSAERRRADRRQGPRELPGNRRPAPCRSPMRRWRARRSRRSGRA